MLWAKSIANAMLSERCGDPVRSAAFITVQKCINWAKVFALALGLCLSVIATVEAKPEVTGVRAGQQPGAVRFVIELSEKVDYKVFTLPDPYRIIIDFPAVDWKINSDMVNQMMRESAIIKSFRYGQFTDQRARIVMEVAQPVTVQRNFLLNPVGAYRYRFVIDMQPTDADAFMRESEANKPVATPVAAVKPLVAPPRRDARRIIVIDPGHGGIDPGALGVRGNQEKSITLAVARELARQLNASKRYRVVLTRDEDKFMALRDRVAFARHAGAELFISLHADSHPDAGTRGASVYTLSEDASDKESAALASKENKSDVIGGMDLTSQDRNVASILIDLAQRETMNRSKSFAAMLTHELTNSDVLLLRNTHRYAGFAVLTAPDVPAVLLELGYLSNPGDEGLLLNRAHQQRLARAIMKAADAYFAASSPTVAADAPPPAPPKAARR